MKKLIAIGLILIGIIFFSRYYFIKTEKELNIENKNVDSAWGKVIIADKKRAGFLRNNINQFNGLIETDRLDSLLNITYYPDACNKEYIYRQSKINNYTVISTDMTKGKGLPGVSDILEKYDSISNSYINQYNKKAKKFNKKASSFPNIIVSRRHKYKRKVMCRIEYGTYSNIEEEDKKAMDWMLKMEKEKGL